MRNKEEEAEALAQSQRYAITGISKTWWDESCDYCARMGSCGLYSRNRLGR